MTKETSTSILPAEDIEKHVKNKYEPTSFTTNIYRREEVDFYIKVVTERNGFKVETPYRFDEKDILEVAADMLREKGINGEPVCTIVEMEDGDAREPMDYGSPKFKGVKFKWNEE